MIAFNVFGSIHPHLGRLNVIFFGGSHRDIHLAHQARRAWRATALATWQE